MVTHTMAGQPLRVPIWFRLFALVSLLWNLLGLMTFLVQMNLDSQAIAQMSQAERYMYDTTPVWLNWVLGSALLSGLLGCLLLLLRRRQALGMLLLSLVAVLLHLGYVFGVQDAMAALGVEALPIPLLVLSWAVLLVWVGNFAGERRWLH
ncbi:hypothetical protein LZP73_06095 [Shewanella sp. AS16]|uniref:hypothetical protein n=1 Tax=Shewanella sp. AS16 TaxID=2907625 RepID=UPI001F18C4E8|nr:hypothetical protein [Shewanella sp. AS16]MCE9685788.1 hypothetical protein [Shewanella sp. AS16]